MNKRMTVVLLTFIVLISSATIAYAVKPDKPNLGTLIQDIMDLLELHYSEVQIADSVLQGSVDAVEDKVDIIDGVVDDISSLTQLEYDILDIHNDDVLTATNMLQGRLGLIDEKVEIIDGVVDDIALDVDALEAQITNLIEGPNTATTFEFNCESWNIYISGNPDSEFTVYYSATITYLDITENVQDYHVYTMVAGDAFVPIYSSPVYSGVAHVSLTIFDPSLSPGDLISINGRISADSMTHYIPMAELSYNPVT